MSLTKSQVTKLVVDLCWEYDRMSSSGQETLDKLCKVLGIETEAEMDELLASMSKEEINNDCLLYTSPSPRDLVISRMPSSA